MGDLLHYLPNWMKNKYFITILAFLIWMFFLDSYDFISQYKRRQEINKIKAHIEYYQTEIVRTNEEKKALFGNEENLEKFARENYWMKKKNEDLFVISNK